MDWVPQDSETGEKEKKKFQVSNEKKQQNPSTRPIYFKSAGGDLIPIPKSLKTNKLPRGKGATHKSLPFSLSLSRSISHSEGEEKQEQRQRLLLLVCIDFR